MASLKIAFFILCLFTSQGWASQEGKILYLTQTGDQYRALSLYQEYKNQRQSHDFALLQKMALALLEQGARTNNPEIQLLCLFGAGVSANEKTLPILEEAVQNQNPILQLVAINLLARFQNDHADDAIKDAMSSNFLPIRFEAAYLLAKRHYPSAYAQTEALMHKIPKQLMPLMSKILVLLNEPQAVSQLRKLLSEPNLETRVETVLQCAEKGRDELLPQIRLMASQHEVHQQEACAYALGKFRDKASLPILEKLAASFTIPVRLAALKALYHLGYQNVPLNIKQVAKQGDLFAIALLGEMEGSDELLKELLQSPDKLVRLNAGISLLKLRNSSCLPVLKEIFVKDSRDLALKMVHSPGGTLTAFKVFPNAQQMYEEDPSLEAESLEIEMNLLELALELPEQQFLNVAQLILDHQRNELVPFVISLMEDIQSPQTIEMLKKYQQKAGAPLIRNACNLALYRLKEPGPYEEQLIQWVQQQWRTELIRFKPLEELQKGDQLTAYELTPQETSKLLIDSLETLAQNRDDRAISVLLEAIQYGHTPNSYVLAGLLLNATQ